MRKSLIIFSVLLLLCLCVGGVSASANGGLHDGVYEIYDASDLTAFATYINSDVTHVATNAKLMADIDLTGVTWTPIGTSSNAYAGTFDGNGYIISNFNNPLFGDVSGATITKLGADVSNIASFTLASRGGIFVNRYIGGNSEISNCYLLFDTASGSSTSSSIVAPFGTIQMDGETVSISNTYVIGNSFGYTIPTGNGWIYVGGLIGQQNDRVFVDNCYVKIGTLISNRVASSTYGAGGLCGILSPYDNVMGNVLNTVSIISTYTTGSSSGLKYYRIGYASNISNCYALYPNNKGTTSSDATSKDGKNIDLAGYSQETFWRNTVFGSTDYDANWYWDTDTSLPKLQVFRQSSAPSVTVTTPSSPVAINTAINLDATASPYVAGNHLTYNWQYSTDSGSTWSASIGTTEDITYTPTGNPAVYQFRCTVTETETTLSASATTNDVRVVTAPTINTATITPSIGKLSTAYTPAITIPITGLGGAQTVYYKLQQLSGSTWSDISGKAGTATATGSKTLTVSINDASETTHSYRVLVSSLSDYTASVTATSNTVTFTTFAPPATPTAEIRPSTITINTATEVILTASNVPTAPTGNTYYYQWFYGSTSTPSAGDTAITEQETTLTNPATWSATFTATGTKYVYLKITDAAGNDPVYSARQTLSIVSMQATVTWVDPSATSYTDQFRLYLSGAGIGDTKQWYYQQTAPTVGQDTQISGATSGTYTTTASALGLTPGNTYIFKCYVTTGGTTIQLSTGSITPYKKPEFTSITPPESGGVPLTITFSATATDATSIVYLLSSDDIIYSEVTSPYTINQIGTYYWKAKATGLGGVTYSNVTTFIVSDLAPVFSSATVSPSSGIGRFTVTFTASATNNPTYTWYERSGGVDTQIGTGATLSYIIQNRATGDYTFRCKAVNQYGTAYSSLLTVSVGNTPQTQITDPSNGATRMEDRAVQFNASYQGTASTTFSWNFGDGGTGTGASTTHTYTDVGTYTVTCTGTNSFGSDSATITLHIIEYSPVFVEIDDITATGVTATGYIDQTPISPDTTMYLIVKSKSGQTIMQTNKETYVDGVTFDADGMPLISGQQYQIQAIANNGYGKSAPVMFTLDNASREPQSHLSTIYTQSGLDRDPFNVSKLLDGGIQAYAGALGGGTVGAAIAFGLIVVFTAVGLWLRQGHFVIPMCLVLAGGWFVIGNLPGEWQPIAYTLMVICIIAIIFVLFRKQHEQ